MKHIIYFAFALGLLGCLSISFAQQQTTCSPGSLPLQLGELAESHSIDDCSCVGAPKGAAGSQIRKANNLQNSIKNNFTRNTANPKIISIRDMIRLQERVDDFSMAQLPRGDRFTLPSPQQRTLLTNLTLGPNRTVSEGDVVTVAGYILGARHSNLESGESVNCEKSGCENNDVHIELAAHPRDTDVDKAEQMNEEGVVAELSPRHRPSAWHTFDSPGYRNLFKNHPVAFTGQLFYDASHSPGGAPDRASVWEIHPVYAIWVCRNTTPQECRLNSINDESVWLPFHKVRSEFNLQIAVTQRCKENP